MKKYFSFQKMCLAGALLYVSYMMTGCAGVQEASPVSIPFYDAKPEPEISAQYTADPPRTVAILPFCSLVEEKKKKDKKEEINSIPPLRKNFYSQMSSLPFRCISPDKVDAVLKEKGIVTIEEINKVPAHTYGEMFHVDAVVYGDIESAANFTGGVYSNTEYKGTLKMVETKDDVVLWKVRHFEKMLGGLLENSSELVSLIESQMESAKAELSYEQCADMFNREILGTLPQITLTAEDLPMIEKIDIQPQGQTEFGLYDTIEITLHGEKELYASFNIGESIERVPMFEISPGVYKGTYTVMTNDSVQEAYITLTLGDRYDMRMSIVPVTGPVSIYAKSLLAPRNVRVNVENSENVLVSWDTSPSGQGSFSYEIYRAYRDRDTYKHIGTTQDLRYADSGLKESGKYYYQVVVRDAYRNKSKPSEPVEIEIETQTSQDEDIYSPYRIEKKEYNE